jgi:hypothetical protein
MKRRTLQLLLLVLLPGVGALGQIDCSSGPASTKLVCEFPFSTGVYKNDTALGGSLSGIQSASAKAQVFNAAIAAQVSQLPLASASAGEVLRYKGSVPETFHNLGPILTDRAETVGRHKLFVGFTASKFVFTDIDGNTLGKLPFAYFATAYLPGTKTVISNTYTSEVTNLNFRIDQFIGVATFGLTDKIDLSVIIPSERVSLGATTENSESYIVNTSNVVVAQYTNASTHSAGVASGVGDVTINVKAVAWQGEHATFSGAMSFRAPTGDDLNYLGSGAWGFNPYLSFSYLARLSPHAKIGYKWNTATELNTPTNAAGVSLGKQALPGGLQYDIGGDFALHRRLTLAADLLGNQYVNTPVETSTTTPLTTATQTINLPTSVSGNSTYSVNNLSAGLKLNPVGNLVIAGNALFQLNNNGLRSRVTPLIGISYKF